MYKNKMRQIPQLTSSRSLNINKPFYMSPKRSKGTKRSLIIVITYTGQNVGELKGCHNDAINMKEHLCNFHDFQ